MTETIQYEFRYMPGLFPLGAVNFITNLKFCKDVEITSYYMQCDWVLYIRISKMDTHKITEVTGELVKFPGYNGWTIIPSNTRIENIKDVLDNLCDTINDQTEQIKKILDS